MIDQYEIRRSLSKGGMGEIFLVYDPLCKREIVLKQILPKLQKHPIIKARFLREAEVASKLNHPSIIPVFSIDPSAQKSYYTMPFIEGETLKQILKRCLEEEKKNGASETSLLLNTRLRLFLQLCEAVSYAHSKQIVHRDLKPDNVLVGKYGEVLIFDWGLSDFEGEGQREEDLHEEEDLSSADLTRPGKVPGTLNYIAPERITGAKTTALMDIFSLGVILYQLLTLRSPFQRKSIDEFKKQGDLIPPLPPSEQAPYLHIPDTINTLTMQCLAAQPQDRIKTVSEIIATIREWLDGHPKWIKTSSLDIDNPEDWEFQENILFAKHLAITTTPSITRWASLMVAKSPFFGNITLEIRFKLAIGSEGISFLLGVPSREERTHFLQGIQIYLGTSSALLYNGATLMPLLGGTIHDDQFHLFVIEKEENHLSLFLDGKKIGFYILRTPLPGNHIGLFAYDAEFQIKPILIKEKGLSAQVSCLAIPDAFLSHGDFKKARIEYLKIASSFPGSIEEREAHFRAGMTLLQEAKTTPLQEERERALLQSLDQFDYLHKTPSAPLEYIGKSLVYKEAGEIEEEVKCLELAIRKYKKHPLYQAVQDEILLRLYETSSTCRMSAYRLALLALFQIPQITSQPEHTPLFDSIQKQLPSSPLFLSQGSREQALSCQLAFLLGRETTLLELMEIGEPSIKFDASYALLMLSQIEGLEENLSFLPEGDKKELLKKILFCKRHEQGSLIASLIALPDSFEKERALYLVLETLLETSLSPSLLPVLSLLPHTPWIDTLHIKIALGLHETTLASSLLARYPDSIKNDPLSPLFEAKTLFLWKTKGKQEALSHLTKAPYSLMYQYATLNEIERKEWIEQKLLFWERKKIEKELRLIERIRDG